MTGRPFIQGVSMPLHGLDQMLVTFAVGMIAAQMGGRARWALPCAFSVLLLLGGALNVAGLPVPLAEQVLFASTIVLGGLLASRWRAPLWLVLGIVAIVAAIQGNTLIGEAPRTSWFFLFASGCLLAAFALQATGLAVGLLIERFNQKQAYRYAGWWPSRWLARFTHFLA
jgi:urease accessory protein